MTLPRPQGRLATGETVWSEPTDVAHENLANLHGINPSAKMADGLIGKATHTQSIDTEGTFILDAGRVDCTPDRAPTPVNAPDVNRNT